MTLRESLFSGNKNYETTASARFFFSEMKNYMIRTELKRTDRIKTILTQECQTTLGLAPPGATSKIQLLDVASNGELKK